MANSGLQILGFALALLGVIGLIIGTILPQWKMSAYVGDNIITAVSMYEGLWMTCAFQSTGQIQCKVYDSILQLNSALQATRALMIVSIIVSLAGLGVACMGMKCTNCGGDDKARKSKIAMIGGIIILIGCKKAFNHFLFLFYPWICKRFITNVLHSLTALCSVVACSWYAHDIIRAFYDPFTPVNTKYEFGSAIFIAWAGAFLAVVGGAMLSASCPRGKPSPKYPISRPPSSKEYV
ncbi:claudin-7-A-like isoform X1 [Hippoglossus hippoglossus]|uniref:claudin-7-A-like isoform X1 n=1 Tax=Hippoglossus hippoglossus TaxID=8267 RepID=UPI00148B78E3|nr:claudin-7-A-like isoform X1 [Hippoglossus hippoglossus]XP_035035313.1 claudin-7-A isoform X1 [Hippoglossus stenolepis]